MSASLVENVPEFAGLTEEQKAVVCEQLVQETRQAGQPFYGHGEIASKFYLIKTGYVRLRSEQGAILANLGPGAVFGDADALLSGKYVASATAVGEVGVYALDMADVAALVAQEPEIGLRLSEGFGTTVLPLLAYLANRRLRPLPGFSDLPDEALFAVARRLAPRSVAEGETLFAAGEPATGALVVDEGRVAATDASGSSRDVGPGGLLSESAVLEGKPHTLSAQAAASTRAWELSTGDLTQLCAAYPALRAVFESPQDAAAGAARLPAAIPTVVSEEESKPRPAATARGGAVTGAAAVRPPATRAARPEARPAARPAMRPVPAPAAGGLGRTVAAASAWFASRSVGAKVRVVALVLLLIWLLGVAAPSALISLLGGSAEAANGHGAYSGSDAPILIAYAAPDEPAATFTPWPTDTPAPTATFTPSPTPTDTPVPTATLTPTPLPPTATQVPPTATRVPPTAVPLVRAAPAPAVLAAPPPPTAAPPKSSKQFKLTEMRRLTPCENGWKHNIFITVVDAAGNPVDGVTLIQSPRGQYGNVLDKQVTGSKGPGKAEFVMWKQAEYSVYVTQDGANPGNTDIAEPLHSNFTDEERCGDSYGNTLFHNSFNVTFQKTF